jgi:hypothetical protein
MQHNVIARTKCKLFWSLSLKELVLNVLLPKFSFLLLEARRRRRDAIKFKISKMVF